MMWMLFVMDGNKQEGKWLNIESKALKWAKANSTPHKRSPWWVPMADGNDFDITFTITMIIKQRRVECIKCMNKGDELYDVLIYYTKFLKYDFSWHWIEGVCHV
jgi:hypothetical protein